MHICNSIFLSFQDYRKFPDGASTRHKSLFMSLSPSSSLNTYQSTFLLQYLPFLFSCPRRGPNPTTSQLSKSRHETRDHPSHETSFFSKLQQTTFYISVYNKFQVDMWNKIQLTVLSRLWWFQLSQLINPINLKIRYYRPSTLSHIEWMQIRWTVWLISLVYYWTAARLLIRLFVVIIIDVECGLKFIVLLVA